MCDFEEDSSSCPEEQVHYLEALLSKQLALARRVCSDTPFAAVLQKRLLITQRILFAIASKYHDPEKIHQQNQTEQEEEGEESGAVETMRSGTDALIEMGVKTGLRLVFSLLQQQWASPPTSPVSLCNDVLLTAQDVLCSLPPLSLANENKLAALGRTTLGEVNSFLKRVSMPRSGADAVGKRLSAQLALALAAQRGSLRYTHSHKQYYYIIGL